MGFIVIRMDECLFVGGRSLFQPGLFDGESILECRSIRHKVFSCQWKTVGKKTNIANAVFSLPWGKPGSDKPPRVYARCRGMGRKEEILKSHTGFCKYHSVMF